MVQIFLNLISLLVIIEHIKALSIPICNGGFIIDTNGTTICQNDTSSNSRPAHEVSFWNENDRAFQFLRFFLNFIISD